MKLLCSSISEDDGEPCQALDDFMGSLDNRNIVEMLDNSAYPSNLRLKLLFDSSFQRLSAEEKEALVSLCVLPESFDMTVAAAALGVLQNPLAKRVLGNLRRKSLLESSSKSGLFSMHPLIRSFANEIGEKEMKETNLKSRARLSEFYLHRFKELNEKFLTGQSMSAFIDFYQDEQSIEQSLIEGCSDSKTAKSVFEVLVKAELFLRSLYFREKFKFHKIYDSALKMAATLEEYVVHSQLLVSKALYQVTWGARGETMELLSEARDIEALCSSVSSVADKGKRLCYEGIYQMVNGQTEIGVQSLEEVVSLMSGSPEKRILRIIAVQILATYCRSKNDFKRTSELWFKSLVDWKRTGNTELLIIPTIPTFESIENPNRRKVMTQQPLRFQIICLVSEAVKHLKANDDTTSFISDAAQQIAKDIEKSPVRSSLGLFIFQRNVNITLQKVLKNFESVHKVAKQGKTSWHEMSLNKRRMSSEPHEGVRISEPHVIVTKSATVEGYYGRSRPLDTTDMNNSQFKKQVCCIFC